jgi:hypothetical protein
MSGRYDMYQCESLSQMRQVFYIADGPDAVLKACRISLRGGATHIKIAVSGGVASPSDPLMAVQFTPGEVQSAVKCADCTLLHGCCS